MIRVKEIICEKGKTDLQKADSLYAGITSGEKIIFSNDPAEQDSFMEMYKKCDVKKLVDLIIGEGASNISFFVEKKKKVEGGNYVRQGHSVRGINIVENDYHGTYDVGLNNSYQANARKLLEDL